MTRIAKLAMVVALLLVIGGDATPASVRSALLRIEMTGLPTNVAGQVTVTGPDGTYTIAATDERGVSPGRYTLTFYPVHSAGVTYYSADDHKDVVVNPGPTTTAATYQVAIPDTTTVLDPADPAIIAVRANLIHLAVNSPLVERIHPGDHIVSGEGPQVPHLLVRRVTSVGHSGDHVVVDTVPATFDEALPAGLLRFNTIDGLKIVRPVAYANTDRPLVDMKFSLNYASGSCSAASDTPRSNSIAGEVKYKLNSIHLDVGGDLSWSLLHPSVSLSASAKLTVQHSVQADIEAAVRCHVDAEREFRLGCVRVLAHLVRIGPISLDCDFKIHGEATVASTAAWHTSTIEEQSTLGFQGGYDSNGSGIHAAPTLTTKQIGEKPATPDHELSLGASLGLQVGLVGRDPGGIASLSADVEVSGGPTVKSSSTEFRADLEFAPKIKTKATLSLLFHEWSKGLDISLVKASANIWKITRSDPLSSATVPPSQPLFVGDWIGHSQRLTVSRDGAAHLLWRDYLGRHTGDRFFAVDLDAILRNSGGVMVGEVTRSNTLLIPVGSPVRVERGPDQYVMVAYVSEVSGAQDDIYVCTETAPPGHCGA